MAKQPNRSITRGTVKNTAKRSPKDIYEILKVLQENLYNYSLTARQCGVTTTTLRNWRDKYPEAFNNRFQEAALQKIEAKLAIMHSNVLDKARNVLDASLQKGLELLEGETDLNKVANFIRAIEPMTRAVGSGDAGAKTFNAIQSTLGKLAYLKSSAVDAEEVKG